MAGFITTDDGDWVFKFDEEPVKRELPKEPNMATGYLEGPGKWDNYSDKVLYECEYLLRQFFESKLDDPKWTSTSTKYRRYTCGMMFEVLFGRKYDSKTDNQYGVRLGRILAYYSTRITKEGSIMGKRYKKKIHYLSLKRYKQLPPYSLRLRLEWLQEQGRIPCWQNMKLPKDDLKAGHARNKRTDKNMEIRRERGKQLYRERYRSSTSQS